MKSKPGKENEENRRLDLIFEKFDWKVISKISSYTWKTWRYSDKGSLKYQYINQYFLQHLQNITVFFLIIDINCIVWVFRLQRE